MNEVRDATAKKPYRSLPNNEYPSFDFRSEACQEVDKYPNLKDYRTSKLSCSSEVFSPSCKEEFFASDLRHPFKYRNRFSTSEVNKADEFWGIGGCYNLQKMEQLSSSLSSVADSDISAATVSIVPDATSQSINDLFGVKLRNVSHNSESRYIQDKSSSSDIFPLNKNTRPKSLHDFREFLKLSDNEDSDSVAFRDPVIARQHNLPKFHARITSRPRVTVDKHNLFNSMTDLSTCIGGANQEISHSKPTFASERKVGHRMYDFIRMYENKKSLDEVPKFQKNCAYQEIKAKTESKCDKSFPSNQTFISKRRSMQDWYNRHSVRTTSLTSISSQNEDDFVFSSEKELQKESKKQGFKSEPNLTSTDPMADFKPLYSKENKVKSIDNLKESQTCIKAANLIGESSDSNEQKNKTIKLNNTMYLKKISKNLNVESVKYVTKTAPIDTHEHLEIENQIKEHWAKGKIPNKKPEIKSRSTSALNIKNKTSNDEVVRIPSNNSTLKQKIQNSTYSTKSDELPGKTGLFYHQYLNHYTNLKSLEGKKETPQISAYSNKGIADMHHKEVQTEPFQMLTNDPNTKIRTKKESFTQCAKNNVYSSENKAYNDEKEISLGTYKKLVKKFSSTSDIHQPNKTPIPVKKNVQTLPAKFKQSNHAKNKIETDCINKVKNPNKDTSLPNKGRYEKMKTYLNYKNFERCTTSKCVFKREEKAHLQNQRLSQSLTSLLEGTCQEHDYKLGSSKDFDSDFTTGHKTKYGNSPKNKFQHRRSQSLTCLIESSDAEKCSKYETQLSFSNSIKDRNCISQFEIGDKITHCRPITKNNQQTSMKQNSNEFRKNINNEPNYAAKFKNQISKTEKWRNKTGGIRNKTYNELCSHEKIQSFNSQHKMNSRPTSFNIESDSDEDTLSLTQRIIKGSRYGTSWFGSSKIDIS